MIDLLSASKMNDEATRCGGGSDEKRRSHTRKKICSRSIFYADKHPYQT